MSILVASIPSGHVYVRHLASPSSSGPSPVVRLPDPPAVRSVEATWWPPRMLSRAWISEHASEFDVMHIHFGFDALSPDDLQGVVRALREHDKPLVVTVHDLRNPHHDAPQLHDAQLGVLVDAADALITLTRGAAAEVMARWGREATVLPHPQVVPDEWLDRVRPRRGEFVVGVHAKSLRANMDPVPLIDSLVEALPGMPGARLRVDAHTEVMTPGFVRHDALFSDRVTALERLGLIELRVHDYFSDDDLWQYLHGLDVSVLPYRFGTHSGWLEACHDLGTWVVAPDCGFYAEQRPTLSYSATGPDRLTSVVEAVRTAHDRWLSGESASRATRNERRAERESLARSHEAIYSELRARRLRCTS